MKITSNWGMRLLAVWLLLSGIIPLLNLTFNGIDQFMQILVIAAGVFILINK